MIEEEKYCINIPNQIKAVRNAISTVEVKVLKKHIQACVKDALKSDQDFDDKVEELIKTLKR
jgi:DNA-binding FrmR family transcriptional regulator|tara:strand:+ start:143 stop:328 length:186 start_codon:yes stop_codon:yes gene_type:complete